MSEPLRHMAQVLRRFHRRNYHRAYAAQEPLPAARPPGRMPRLSRERYDALRAWNVSSRATRIKLWDLADQWGEDPGYLWYAVRNGIKRYDAERYRELVTLIGECVDEARAQP